MGKKSTLSDQARRLIQSSGLTCYRLNKETGIDTATLSRFVNGKAGLSMRNVEALADYFGWQLVEMKPKRKGRRASGKHFQ